MSADQQEPPDYATPLRAFDQMRVVRHDEGLTVTAAKRITATGPYLAAHFPGRPVYPGVFLVEAVRQSVVAAHEGAVPTIGPDISAVHSLRFFHPLLPGDEVTIQTAASLADPAGEVRATARCRRQDGTEVARMTLGFRSGTWCQPLASPAAGNGHAGTDAHRAAQLLDHAGIRAILPHGAAMVLVDRADAGGPRHTLHAVKAISAGEPCYQHLRAGLPADRYAYPVSLIIESFGQAAAVAWQSGPDRSPLDDSVLMFAAARDCRFHGRGYPGDVLRHEVTFERTIARTGFATGEIWAGHRLIATMGSVVAVVRPPPRDGPRAPGARLTPASARVTVSLAPARPAGARFEPGSSPDGDSH